MKNVMMNHAEMDIDYIAPFVIRNKSVVIVLSNRSGRGVSSIAIVSVNIVISSHRKYDPFYTVVKVITKIPVVGSLYNKTRRRNLLAHFGCLLFTTTKKNDCCFIGFLLLLKIKIEKCLLSPSSSDGNNNESNDNRSRMVYRRKGCSVTCCPTAIIPVSYLVSCSISCSIRHMDKPYGNYSSLINSTSSSNVNKVIINTIINSTVNSSLMRHSTNPNHIFIIEDSLMMMSLVMSLVVLVMLILYPPLLSLLLLHRRRERLRDLFITKRPLIISIAVAICQI